MGFKIVEDRPTPKEVYNFQVYFAAFLISWGAITFGYDSAFFGTTITRKSFIHDFGLDVMTKAQVTATSSNLTSCFQAAAFFGAAFSWGSMEMYGRKITLLISSIIFVIGSIMQTVAVSQLGLVYAGRSICGLAVGGITGVVPAFISEIAPPPIRGRLTGFFEIAYQVGAVIGFWINYGISQNQPLDKAISWRIPMAVQLIPGGILFIACFFLKESPLFLLKAGKEEECYKVLTYLRQLPADHIYIQEEVAMFKDRIETERAVAHGGSGLGGYIRGAFKECMLPGIRNRVALAFIMFGLQNFSGANAINYYSVTLFKSIGISDTALYTGIYGLVKAIGSIIFYIWFIDLWGRRQPWMVSSTLCAVCLIGVGVYVKVGHPADQAAGTLSASTIAGGKAATALIMIYSVCWSFGANGLPWIITSEIYPLRLRGLLGAWSAMCQWAWQLCITKTTPYIFLSMGWGVWIFFAGCLILSAVWAFFFLPETKGLALTDMDKLFGFNPATHGYHDAEHGRESPDKKEEARDYQVEHALPRA